MEEWFRWLILRKTNLVSCRLEAAAKVAQSNAAVVDTVIEDLKPFLDALPAGNSDARA